MKLLDRIAKILTGLLIFLIPMNFDGLLYQAQWGRGFYNPYTSISLTAVEILTCIIFVFVIIKKHLRKETIHYGKRNVFLSLLFLISTVLLSLLISPHHDKIFQLIMCAKIMILFMMYMILVNQEIKIRSVVYLFILSMCLQSILVILQFIFQQSLGLHIIGEPVINAQIPQIAKFTIHGHKLIRPYGTFSHPNILAGFLGTAILLTSLINKHFQHEKTILISLLTVAFLFSFSRNALLAIMISGIFLLFWNKDALKQVVAFKNTKLILTIIITIGIMSPIITLWIYRIISITNDNAIQERLVQARSAIEIFGKYPFGVGFGQVTMFIDSVKSGNIMPWEYQPVHNIFLLILAETGYLGLLAMIILIVTIIKQLMVKNKKLLSERQHLKIGIFFSIIIFVITISQFDHYMLTLDHGRYLFILLLGIVSVFLKNPRHILPIRMANKKSKDQDDR